MITVFTRSISEDLASLVKRIDKAVKKHEDAKLRAFVVYLTEDPDAAEGQLKALAAELEIENVPLTVFEGAAGPPGYKIAKDAEFTVVMWRALDVKAVHAVAKGKLKKKKIQKILADTSKILKEEEDEDDEA